MIHPRPNHPLSGQKRLHAECLGTVAIHTQGCKLNQADSEVMSRQFAAAGYRLVDSAEEADVFVLSTCTVTSTADAKARQALRAARRSNPQLFVVAVGCYPQRAPGEVAQVEGVSLVVSNTQKDQVVPLVMASQGTPTAMAIRGRNQPAAPTRATARGPVAFTPTIARARAMVKIQEGCNQVCAYCIVPKVRGRERSIDPDTLIQRIRERVSQGFAEVVLTGTQLGTYGFDIPGASLSGLLDRILVETAVPRLRVSSLQAQEITPELLGRWENPRLCPHFHIPLQSGSDTILRAMRRRYDTLEFAETVDLVRRTIPSAGTTTDLIVGFPGEGEAEFLASLGFADLIAFSDMHLFPYSVRPGTSAAYLASQVSGPVKKERMSLMAVVADKNFQKFRMRQLGQTRSVLWESRAGQNGSTVCRGLTDNYIRVRTDASVEPGATTQSKLVQLMDDSVYVEPL